MSMPVLAVVGADHQIIRSTETFRLKCESSVALCERSPELDLVLTGQTDTAVLDLGDFRLSIEAVTDAAGKRQAMLSLPTEDLAAEDDAPLAALREAADESPAIVWAKDLDGRYLYANARYERELDIAEERLLGNTDADLPPVETVDGPRLRYADDGLKEPLQLEYSVPALDSRPPMVAFRFPLRNGRGQAVGTCGVAAPAGKSQVARDEAVRLMQLERWNRLDPVDVRAELLEQWHVQATPGPVAGAEPEAEVKTRNGRVKLFSRRAVADKPAAVLAPVAAEPAPPSPAEAEAPRSAQGGADPAHQREDEWVRQLRQAAAMTPDESGSDTAGALHSDLQLAREWAERANQLQGDLHEANARVRAAEAETQQALAEQQQASAEAQQARAELEQGRSSALLAADETTRLQTELEQLRAELDRERTDAQAARSELEAAHRELETARARADSLRAPADAAVRLSEELEHALAAQQERGDELARTLGRIRARLGDLDGAEERSQPTAPHGS